MSIKLPEVVVATLHAERPPQPKNAVELVDQVMAAFRLEQINPETLYRLETWLGHVFHGLKQTRDFRMPWNVGVDGEKSAAVAVGHLVFNFHPTLLGGRPLECRRVGASYELFDQITGLTIVDVDYWTALDRLAYVIDQHKELGT